MSDLELREKAADFLAVTSENEAWLKGRWYRFRSWSTLIFVVAAYALSTLVVWALYLAGWWWLLIMYVALLVGLCPLNGVAEIKHARFIKKWNKKYYKSRDDLREQLTSNQETK